MTSNTSSGTSSSTSSDDFGDFGTAAPGGHAVRPPTTSAERFFAAVRRWGAVRGQERWIGGVCGAIAARHGLNPLAVRVGFIALALLGGVGIALYGVLWALLPDVTGRIEAQAAQRGDVSAVLVASVCLVVIDLLLGHGVLGLSWVF
ncbi:PspC domain-containing protein [Kineococcus sp. T13]|uniref:PspC domain-containing protein n=1 Tax=Kineococcus vitellinus TaxID=2696565 RepID=UPI001411D0EC|nr:PspC domain-containing protein [Kineococcus vitellinus]NAZ77748.1 PspC domain-containing protein [Kineococcus vitellinus]